MRNRAGAFATLALVIGVGVLPARADTYTVDTTADAVDAAPGNTICATAGGACALRAAVQEANAHAGADVISIPAGTFRLTLVGAAEELGATGDLDVTESLTVNGAAKDTTILDGFANDRFFEAKNGVALTVRDVTIRNSASSSGGAIAQLMTGTTVVERVRFFGNVSTGGAGILHVDGPLSITDSEFDHNFATGGGGLYMIGTGALSITGTIFSGNTALGADGAAVRSETTGAVSVTGSAFSDNGTDQDGASLFVMNAASGTLADTVFERNRADGQIAGPLVTANGAITVSNVRSLDNFAQALAGGYFASSATLAVSGLEASDNFSLSSATTYLVASMGVTLSDSAFRDNVIFGGGGGGGVYAQSGTSLAVSNVELTGNSAQSGGGGLFVGATTTVDGVLAFGNAAQTGGGLLVQGGTSASITNTTADGNQAIQVGGLYAAAPTLTLSSSTISNNSATGPGAQVGGLYVATANPSTVTNVTVSGNSADTLAGGVYTAASVTLRNVTIAGNTAATDSALFNSGGPLTVISTIIAGGADPCGGVITSGGNNIDQSGTCGFAAAGDQNGVDPQLGPLADNGGPTLTHLPASASPAVDTGAAAGCPATDQRGQTRPADGNGDGSSICDVGAVEFLDLCPSDPNKTTPGVCGCGVADTDADQANGTADCLVQGELKARIARARTVIAALAGDADPLEGELALIGASFGPYVKAQGSALQAVNPKPKLKKLAKKAGKTVKKVTKAKAGAKLDAAKTKANTALDAFDANVAPQS